MATSGSWRITGTVTGLAAGSRSVDVSITAPSTAIDGSFVDVHGSGIFNAITVPTGATAVLIIPPSGNAQTITLKGVTGDTGVPLSKTMPSAIALGSSPSLGILTGGAVTIELVFM